MMALIYIGIACYLLIGLSVYKYVIEGGDKLHVGILWLFGWGFYVLLALVIMLVLPFVESFKYIRNKCRT